MKKQDVWDITVLQEVTLRVCFDEEVTEEEALELFTSEEYADISDERDHYTRQVLEMK